MMMHSWHDDALVALHGLLIAEIHNVLVSLHGVYKKTNDDVPLHLVNGMPAYSRDFTVQC